MRRAQVALGVVFVAALVAAPAHGRYDTLRGDRIDLIGCATTTVSASDWSFVRHGWGHLHPNEYTAPERRERLATDVWRFELLIDDVLQPLHRLNQWLPHGPDPTGANWANVDYVQFSPGDLSPGTHWFGGRWYGDQDDDGESELAGEANCLITITP